MTGRASSQTNVRRCLEKGSDDRQKAYRGRKSPFMCCRLLQVLLRGRLRGGGGAQGERCPRCSTVGPSVTSTQVEQGHPSRAPRAHRGLGIPQKDPCQV